MPGFYIKCKIENPINRTRSAVLEKLLVDTGSEFTWVSEKTLDRIGIKQEKKDVGFVLANGKHITRSFAQPGDLMLLGARTLEGLNLTVEPGCRRLVAAGPLPAATPVR